MCPLLVKVNPILSISNNIFDLNGNTIIDSTINYLKWPAYKGYVS